MRDPLELGLVVRGLELLQFQRLGRSGIARLLLLRRQRRLLRVLRDFAGECCHRDNGVAVGVVLLRAGLVMARTADTRSSPRCVGSRRRSGGGSRGDRGEQALLRVDAMSR